MGEWMMSKGRVGRLGNKAMGESGDVIGKGRLGDGQIGQFGDQAIARLTH